MEAFFFMIDKQLEHRIQQALASLDSIYALVKDSELLQMKRKLYDLQRRHLREK